MGIISTHESIQIHRVTHDLMSYCVLFPAGSILTQKNYPSLLHQSIEALSFSEYTILGRGKTSIEHVQDT
jgi:hypothetical protein